MFGTLWTDYGELIIVTWQLIDDLMISVIYHFPKRINQRADSRQHFASRASIPLVAINWRLFVPLRVSCSMLSENSFIRRSILLFGRRFQMEALLILGQIQWYRVSFRFLIISRGFTTFVASRRLFKVYFVSPEIIIARQRIIHVVICLYSA